VSSRPNTFNNTVNTTDIDNIIERVQSASKAYGEPLAIPGAWLHHNSVADTWGKYSSQWQRETLFPVSEVMVYFIRKTATINASSRNMVIIFQGQVTCIADDPFHSRHSRKYVNSH